MTTLIKNVQVVNGGGGAPVKADVLIREPFIAAIGNFPMFKADQVIFGNEQFLSPGFIDINTSSDRTLALFSNPTCEDFLLQGITSILFGQCGFSLAPSLYGTLHAHQSREDEYHMNCNWRTFGEFVDTLDHAYAFGPNIASLVGHRVVREDLTHNPKKFEKLSMEQIRMFRNVLGTSLREGAFGFSVGLGYAPYTKTSYHELRALADVVAQHKGLCTIHLRNETDSLLLSVKEIVTLAQDTSVRASISHLRPFIGHEEQFDHVLRFLERRFSKAHVYFDINPFPYSAIRVDAFLPSWLAAMDRGVALATLLDPRMEKKILEELPSLNTREALIFRVPTMPFLRGMPLVLFGRNRRVSSRKALLEFMRVTKLRGVLFYKNLNSEYIRKGILSPQSLIATNSSHSGSFVSFRPNRMTDTFPEYIRIAGRAGVSIEKTIEKITATSAALVGLTKRGVLTPGYYADMVLLSGDGTISNVFVNGRRVVADGRMMPLEAQTGYVLRKKIV